MLTLRNGIKMFQIAYILLKGFYQLRKFYKTERQALSGNPSNKSLLRAWLLYTIKIESETRLNKS